jgi:serine protease Do
MFKWVCGFALCIYEHHSDIKQSIVGLHYKNFSKGTSFIISRTGLALCSYHPLEEDIATNKEGIFIKVLAASEEEDISLLQLPFFDGYKPLRLGNSDTVVPGEVLYHYGFGVGSLLGNKGFYHGTDGKFMFASTEMMHGQSGGPVLNEKGEVVAMCKGHFYCTEEKRKKSAFHTGPSLYVPINRVKEFLGKHCEVEQGEFIYRGRRG